MEKSYKFKRVEENLELLIECVLKNENLKKWLFYMVDDPLSQPDVTQNLLHTHIISTPFHEGLLDPGRALLLLNPVDANFNAKPLGTFVYRADIIVPLSKWIIPHQGLLRWVRIADELAVSIDQQRIAGATEDIIGSFRITKINAEFYAIEIPIYITSNVLKGLR